MKEKLLKTIKEEFERIKLIDLIRWEWENDQPNYIYVFGYDQSEFHCFGDLMDIIHTLKEMRLYHESSELTKEFNILMKNWIDKTIIGTVESIYFVCRTNLNTNKSEWTFECHFDKNDDYFNNSAWYLGYGGKSLEVE